MSNGELFLRVCRLVVECSLFVFFCPGNPLYNVLWENRVWPKEPLAQDPRKRNGARAGSPCPATSFKRISYKKRLLIHLGLIVALPPITAKSQATKSLAFLLRFTKKIWFWLQHAKVPRILHALNGMCWNPHARKSAQGRSARGPNIPRTRRFGDLTRPTLNTILYWKIQHFALRLSPKMSPNAAPATKSHTPTSPNTAPATQNASHDWSASHMKRHLECAEQAKSTSNLTKYCACHAKWISWLIRVTHETSFTMRGASTVSLQPHQILRLPRNL